MAPDRGLPAPAAPRESGRRRAAPPALARRPGSSSHDRVPRRADGGGPGRQRQAARRRVPARLPVEPGLRGREPGRDRRRTARAQREVRASGGRERRQVRPADLPARTIKILEAVPPLEVRPDVAAVDLEHGTGDVGSLLRGQERDQAAELDRLAKPPGRDRRGQRRELLFQRAVGGRITTSQVGLSREVRNIPGSTRLIVMPSLARSGMIALASPAMPGRIPFDRSMFPTGCFTELDWIPITRPHRFSRMCGTTARTKRTKFSVTTSNPCRQSSSVRSANRPSAGPPELLTRTSTPPNRSTVAVTTLSMPAAVVRSAGTASTSLPVCPLMSAAAASRSAFVLAQIVTRAPSRASARADALPRPRLDAPTTATLPASPRSTSHSRSRLADDDALA